MRIIHNADGDRDTDPGQRDTERLGLCGVQRVRPGDERRREAGGLAAGREFRPGPGKVAGTAGAREEIKPGVVTHRRREHRPGDVPADDRASPGGLLGLPVQCPGHGGTAVDVAKRSGPGHHRQVTQDARGRLDSALRPQARVRDDPGRGLGSHPGLRRGDVDLVGQDAVVDVSRGKPHPLHDAIREGGPVRVGLRAPARVAYQGDGLTRTVVLNLVRPRGDRPRAVGRAGVVRPWHRG